MTSEDLANADVDTEVLYLRISRSHLMDLTMLWQSASQ